MSTNENESEYMARVMRTLLNNPTSADIDFLIEAYTKIGYLASVAEGDADLAYAVRKNEESSAWKRIMESEKMSNAAAEKLAELEIFELKQKEVEAKTRATKIKNLLDAIREAINGIKYIGRLGG